MQRLMFEETSEAEAQFAGLHLNDPSGDVLMLWHGKSRGPGHKVHAWNGTAKNAEIDVIARLAQLLRQCQAPASLGPLLAKLYCKLVTGCMLLWQEKCVPLCHLHVRDRLLERMHTNAWGVHYFIVAVLHTPLKHVSLARRFMVMNENLGANEYCSGPPCASFQICFPWTHC